MFHLTRSQLLEDLHTAFQDAKRHKSKKVYVQKFEQHLEENLQELCDELWNKMYRPRPSSCFIINRERLLEICLATLRKMATRRVLKRVPITWQDKIDMDFVEYLTRAIVLLDPIIHCRVVGDKSEWDDLPHGKSLFYSPVGCGLPIGNLTSQLYSNIYLNVLDQYMKRTLHCRHYGRYVDDFYVVSADKTWLRSLVKPVRAFLQSELDLTLHEGKYAIYPVQYGVSFLGIFLKPGRMTMSRDSIKRMTNKKELLCADFHTGKMPLMRVATAYASFRGTLSHGYNSTLLKCFVL